MSPHVTHELPPSILNLDAVPGPAESSSHEEDSLDAFRQLTPIRSDDLPDREEVERLLGRVRNRVAQIMSRCASVDVFVAAQLDFSSTTDDVEAVYAELQLFDRWFSRLDEPQIQARETREYFELVRHAASRLVEAEHLLAHQVNQWLLTLQSRKGTDSALRLFLTQVAAWHAYVERALAQRKQVVEHLLDSERIFPADALSGQNFEDTSLVLTRNAEEFLRASELELLPAFTHLMQTERSGMLTLLGAGSTYPRREALIANLWTVADLMLAEHPDQGPTGTMIAILCEDQIYGPKFRALTALLEAKDPELTSDALDRHFEPTGQPLDEEERAMVRRAVIIGHHELQVRIRAAAEAPIDTLWQVLVYPQSPLSALHAVAQQVASRGDDDLRKVFYDCVKSRLFAAISKVEQPAEVEVVAPFVLLFFQFNFFIQTRYFEQLQTMLHLFRAQARRFDLDIESYDRLLTALETARHKAGSPKASLPRSIDKLPLPIQRHLAREGSYLSVFACHVNNLIAREVVPHIHVDNLGHYLELTELNRQMLEESLRRLDLNGRRDLIQRVLVHPKCPMIFAGRHLPQLNASELHRIVQSRSTQSEVKRKAMLLRIKKQGGSGGPNHAA